jgi:cytochrome c biogenesis protein CcmG, thiol:disulfide interchange protein DsbE
MTNATKTKASHGSKAVRREAERRRTQRRRVAIALAIVAALVVVGAFALAGGGSDDGGTGPAAAGTVTIDRASGPQLEVGDTVPAFTAPMLGGGTMKWDDYLGTPTVLAIWAPWCPHCQAELPRLSAGVDGHAGVQMVSVATAIGQNPGPTPEEYLSSEGLSFPVGIDDADGSILRGMGVASFPTTYYVDPSGTVVDVTVGEVPADELQQILDDLAATA